MQTSTTHYVDKDTEVEAFILDVPGSGPTMYLNVGYGGGRATFIIHDTAFLDKLANEAERLCREFIGDVPPLEPISYAAIGGVTP